MPHRLSRRATLLLLGVAFGLTFTVQLLLSDGSSAPERKVARNVPAAVAGAPAAAPRLRLVADGTVPALREPRRPRKPRTPQPTPHPCRASSRPRPRSSPSR